MLILLALFLPCSSAYHVLFLHNFGTKSHLYQLFPLVEELLQRCLKLLACVVRSLLVVLVAQMIKWFQTVASTAMRSFVFVDFLTLVVLMKHIV